MTVSFHFGAAAALVLVLAAPASMAQSAEHHPHWGYKGEAGPAHWSELSPDNAACAAGKQQSPVDIDNAGSADLPALEISWPKGTYTVVNNGHTIQANAPAGGTLTIAGKVYDLVQFHFHTPSEHTTAGKPASMEVHFVHREHGGQKLSVVGVLIEDKGASRTLHDIMSAAPPEENKTAELTLDPATLLPASHAYWSYEGSLTTPPCSEIVHWIVLKAPLEAGKDDIAAFRKLFPMNARPVQPLDGRKLLASP